MYGRDEMSTINQRALAMARRIVQKLVVAGGLSASPDLPPAPISVPVPMDDAMGQVVPSHVRPPLPAPVSPVQSMKNIIYGPHCA